jgi:hypothetical protein
MFGYCIVHIAEKWGDHEKSKILILLGIQNIIHGIVGHSPPLTPAEKRAGFINHNARPVFYIPDYAFGIVVCGFAEIFYYGLVKNLVEKQGVPNADLRLPHSLFAAYENQDAESVIQHGYHLV